MKLNAALTVSLLIAASIGIVVPLRAQTMGQTPAPTPAPNTAKPPPKTAPAKTTKPAKPSVTPAPKDEADIQLPGIVQPRPNGTFLTVEVVDGKFKVGFYDAKKKAMTADVARASARWKTNKKLVEDHTILNASGDGKSLVGAAFVAPPYTFRLFLTLLSEDGTAGETYVINMNPSP